MPRILLVTKLEDKDFVPVNDSIVSNHQLTLDKLSYLLKSRELYYETIFAHKIDSAKLEVFDYIISIGGDGTFLKAASYSTNQIIIGVNSDTRSSVGKLLRWDIDSLELLVDCIITSQIKVSNWQVLKASVNGVELPYFAINEIYLGKKNIFHTSKIEVSINKLDYTNSIGNGIIVCTPKGSTAFYKSAGGIEVEDDKLGYVFVLPFLLDGAIANTGLVDNQSTIYSKVLREDHILVMDSDEERLVSLTTSDIVEIYKCPNWNLRVGVITTNP